MVSFRDLVGFYRTAIARCIDVMAMGEFDENTAYKIGHHKTVQQIADIASEPIECIDGNNSILDDDAGYFNEEELLILNKFSMILKQLPDIDRDLMEWEKKQEVHQFP